MQKENAQSLAVAFSATVPASMTAAAELAADLRLALVPSDDRSHHFLLVATGERLELRGTRPGSPGPVHVDFASGRLQYRTRHGGRKHEPLARAVGIKAGRRPEVFDATAGFGRDAFILASLGCRVTMCELSPILASLLADGLKRGQAAEIAGPIIRDRLALVHGDSCEIMMGLAPEQRPAVVYLDPMFPPRGKSALVKKEMQILHELLGQDENGDPARLLATALITARERVVVKRPRTAKPLAGPILPTTALLTPNHRFDIYFVGT